MAPLENPFTVLGLPAPTLDEAEVRRAYFAAVQRHPPHRDADAFRRVRAAYESLATPVGRAAAMLMAPLDVGASLAPLRRRFDEAVARAMSDAREASDVRASIARFVGHFSRIPWDVAFGTARAAPED
jgi:hypothetical protein